MQWLQPGVARGFSSRSSFPRFHRRNRVVFSRLCAANRQCRCGHVPVVLHGDCQVFCISGSDWTTLARKDSWKGRELGRGLEDKRRVGRYERIPKPTVPEVRGLGGAHWQRAALSHPHPHPTEATTPELSWLRMLPAWSRVPIYLDVIARRGSAIGKFNSSSNRRIHLIESDSQHA